MDIGPVTVSGTLTETSGEYLFQGRVSGCFNHACDRCLEKAEQAFDIDVTWIFSDGPQAQDREEVTAGLDEEFDENYEDEAETFPISGAEIDLRVPVWEEIVLATPTKYLCREDCAGLCPECGANLNRTECSCQQTQPISNTGLAGLADLFPNLRPNLSEDSDRAGTKEKNRQNKA